MHDSRLLVVSGLLAVLACSAPDAAARKQRAGELLDARRPDSARIIISGLAAELPADTAVAGLEVRLYSVERRFAEATDAYRRRLILGGSPSPRLLLALLDAAFRDASPAVAVAALDACGLLGIDTVYGDIVTACVDANPAVRRAAIEAIGRLPVRSEGIGRLAWGALDGVDKVRIATVDAFIRMHPEYPKSVHLTRVCELTDNDFLLWRRIVLRALAGDKEMLKIVRRDRFGRIEVLRISAADCLVRIGERNHLPAVAAGLRSTDPLVRALSARALGELRAPEYLTDVIAATGDSDETVRWWATRALGEIGDTLALPALSALLADTCGMVRAEAVAAFAGLGGTDEAVVPSLADNLLPVRAAAVAALYVLSGPGEPAPQP